MAVLAVADPRWRRPAIVSGLIAAASTAHGSFDGESKPRSAQLSASQHHGLLGAGLLGGALLGLAGAAAAVLGRRGRR